MAEHSLMFINLLEPLHNGAGEGLGFIDRPIIREKITGFPIIQPTTIKGVLRASYGNKDKSEIVTALFGPEPGRGDEHAGAASFGEGQLLAFPIRSLKGLFVWATTPLILFRLQQRLKIADREIEPLTALLKEAEGWGETFALKIGEGSSDALLVNVPGKEPRLMLEEFSYTCAPSNNLKKFASELSKMVYDDSYWMTEFAKKLVILPEDSFRYFITNCTEVTPNISIDPGTGTAKGTSLRYTEYLPRESVLYSLITFEKARVSGEANLYDAPGLRDYFTRNKPRIIQLGGDETTGKGLVQLKLFNGDK